LNNFTWRLDHQVKKRGGIEKTASVVLAVVCEKTKLSPYFYEDIDMLPFVL
jgi:hypothetical protein